MIFYNFINKKMYKKMYKKMDEFTLLNNITKLFHKTLYKIKITRKFRRN